MLEKKIDAFWEKLKKAFYPIAVAAGVSLGVDGILGRDTRAQEIETFDNQLGTEYRWIREIPEAWSTENGYLKITSTDKNQPAETIQNAINNAPLFITDRKGDTAAIEVYAELKESYEQVAVLFYRDDDTYWKLSFENRPGSGDNYIVLADEASGYYLKHAETPIPNDIKRVWLALTHFRSREVIKSQNPDLINQTDIPPWAYYDDFFYFDMIRAVFSTDGTNIEILYDKPVYAASYSEGDTIEQRDRKLSILEDYAYPKVGIGAFRTDAQAGNQFFIGTLIMGNSTLINESIKNNGFTLQDLPAFTPVLNWRTY